MKFKKTGKDKNSQLNISKIKETWNCFQLTYNKREKVSFIKAGNSPRTKHINPSIFALPDW